MATDKGERRLAAILSADVAGYSRLMGNDERATVRTLNDYRKVFSDHIVRHKGRVVDTAGDSVLAVFGSVVEAVQCAVDVQSELQASNSALPENRRMAFRVGINVGDVIEQGDGTVYGDGVNIAARLERLAEPGGITVSGTVYDHAESKLPITFQFVGEHAVKNITKPVRTYKVVAGGKPAESSSPDKTLALPDKPSIAVLPFDNLSGDPDQEYFADGIVEDIITGLSHDRGLFVIARNSTFTYKGKAVNVVQVGKELGVRYVIEGSVRKGGNRIRITVQLIDATTAKHLWAERYDRVLEDVFAVQDEITSSITATVAPELLVAEIHRARRKAPEILDSWDCYLRAIWLIHQHTPRSFEDALPFAQRASELDPDSSLGFTAQAWSHLLLASFGSVATFNERLVAGVKTATKAITLDASDAMGHGLLGYADTLMRRFSDAVDRLERAIQLVPNFAFGWGWLGLTHACTGEREKAFFDVEEALRLSPRDPLSATWFSIKGLAEFQSLRYQEAIRWARRGLERNPDHAGNWRVLAASYGQLENLEEARDAALKLRRLAPKVSIESTRLQVPWSDPGVTERYLEGLRRAGLDKPD